jgi:metal-dependent amidase/aminoacylase/carboxypeptidase family protein
MSLQTIVSRNLDHRDCAVVSVTYLHAGEVLFSFSFLFLLFDLVLLSLGLFSDQQTKKQKNKKKKNKQTNKTNKQTNKAFNVLPDTCKFGGTTRDLSPDVFELIKKRFYEIVESTCKAYGCSCEIKFNSYYPSTVNSPQVLHFALNSLQAKTDTDITHNKT